MGEGGPPSAPWEEAELHYRRMWRLRQMSGAELRILLTGDPAEAAPWIESAARYGLVEAQMRLGQMRLDGVGVAKDEAAALDWFTRAARQGEPKSMNMVGRCFENGWGAPVDLVAAAAWYRRSAEAGYDWGEYNYANMLFDGRGVPQDLEQAAMWYRRAAEQGHARAMNLLARCHEEAWGVARDGREAYAWYRRSAESGYFRAEYNFGALLAGQGRMEEALGWLEKACRGATPESLHGMVDALVRHEDPRLTELGRRMARALAAPAVASAGAR
jgi:TPR repeat protein